MAKQDDSKPEAKVEGTPIAAPVAKEEEAPVVAKLEAETSVFNAQIEALTARIEELTKKHAIELEELELKAASAKYAEAEAKLAKAYESLERLERSYGLSAAKVIAMTPASAGQKTPYDIWNEMPDGADKTTFYNEHREAIVKSANKPTKAA